jgi:integrase
MQPPGRIAMPVFQEMRGSQKLKGKWRVRVSVNGLRKNRTVTGTKAEARQMEAEMLMEAKRRAELGTAGLSEAESPAERGPIPPLLTDAPSRRPAKSFFDFCVDDYMPHAEKRLAASTMGVREYNLATLIEFFGTIPLSEIKTAHVEDFKDLHQDRGKAASTINDYLKVLGAVLTYAEDLEYAHGKPKIRRFPEVKKADKGAWTTAEVGLLLKRIGELSPHIYPMVVCLATTGMRKSEVINLQWQDVDLCKGEICIQPHDKWHPKSRRPRTVPIMPEFLPFLSRDRASETWVFPNTTNGGKFASWPQRYFDHARKSAGLTGGPHQLRHFYATHMVLETRDLFLVSRLLGHSYHTVTERYAHLLDEHLDRAREAFSLDVAVGPAELEADIRWGIPAEKVREKVRA